MAKTKKHKERKRHSASNFMPPILPNPTLHTDNTDKLPKIILDCRTKIDDKDINRIIVRLNFVDHKDLRKLNGIRVVDPNTIKMPSKESTIGCYQPGSKTHKAEIWLSSELVKRPKGFETFLYRIAYKDRLLETLLHEIGHHKARLTHSIDKYEDEAYAEKYMLAYRKVWKKHYGPSNFYKLSLKFIINCLRFIFIVVLYPFRKKNEDVDLFYRRLKGEITLSEYTDSLKKAMNSKKYGVEKRKNNWSHPLRKKKYRQRFKLPER
jgi:hypothetical protein